MYIIAGLGNPTREYEKTRHNVGFDTIDVLADKLNTSVDEKKFKGLYGRGIIAGEKVILLKPQTFMNLSGESVREAADFYKVDPEHIIVIYDDISLDVGQLRIRKKGSVLSRFSKEDREKMEQAFKDAAEAVEVMIAEGPDAAMNQFNGHK